MSQVPHTYSKVLHLSKTITTQVSKVLHLRTQVPHGYPKVPHLRDLNEQNKSHTYL